MNHPSAITAEASDGYALYERVSPTSATLQVVNAIPQLCIPYDAGVEHAVATARAFDLGRQRDAFALLAHRLLEQLGEPAEPLEFEWEDASVGTADIALDGANITFAGVPYRLEMTIPVDPEDRDAAIVEGAMRTAFMTRLRALERYYREAVSQIAGMAVIPHHGFLPEYGSSDGHLS